ncbi:hypothetical protein W97_05810 [Coniosporium apollinis CBS 100218]|uniref:Transcription elongation factor 1 homolog n=1 Tax=Coniosporium apollinis (strain CBS 100218) TaxID=1168221 RepID=R7YXB4_CONA1|nr:uncharacterized protein W97_05810 [Coniosporium apollinis CBS 100218]EON66565.1 hypothetical protein W97_05810 [Coniosporium apollinis CBS 100218]
MGKRKKAAKKPQGPKKREKLATTFQCLFCNHENSVHVKFDKKAGLAELRCKVCGQTFQTTINSLSHAVDVYADWIDACDAVAKEAAAADAPKERYRGTGRPRAAPAATQEDDDGDGFVVDDELDAEGEYADE